MSSSSKSIVSGRPKIVNPAIFLDKVRSATTEFFPQALCILFPQDDTCRPTEVWYCDFLVTVKKYSPHLKPNTPFYAALANVVCPPDNLTRKARKEAAMKSQQVMISILPSLGVFGILHRWSRQAKRKIHFFQDAYNCAIVLQKNSNSTSMVDFFQHIRTWENLVAKLEASLCLLYRLLEDAEAGTMHRICRNSVSTNQEFPIDDGDLTIEGCPERPSYVTLLAHTCLVFKCVDDVKSLTEDFILPQCIQQQSHVELQVRYHAKKASVEFKFQTARYKVFKLWLELKAQEEMKLKVDKLLSADFQTRKQKSNTSSSSRSSPMPLQDNHLIVLQPTVGLSPLHHKESVIEAIHPNIFVQSTPVLLDTVSLSDTDHSLQDLSFHQLTTTHQVEHWDSLIIAPSNYLKQCRVQSCLCIFALDHIHEMSFSNPDFYSACGLVNYDHWRSIGCEGSQLTDQFSASNLIKIPSSVLQRLDPLNILDVVRPGSAIYQRCQPYFEGELIKLFQFVFFHGKSPSIPDARRTKDNRIVEIGIHFGTGIIQNTDKFDVLGDDAVVVKATVARMMDFLWHLAQDIQITAKRCPLGGHLSRDKQSLFHCVTLVVPQVFPYPCQGKRH
eukprot:jgi/Psemu1/37306/gm1.37306_g